jgi:hypothetical protein
LKKAILLWMADPNAPSWLQGQEAKPVEVDSPFNDASVSEADDPGWMAQDQQQLVRLQIWWRIRIAF